MVPPLPTAHPTVFDVNHTDWRLNVVLPGANVQLLPASSVFMTRPRSPTAQPRRPSGMKNTPFRRWPPDGFGSSTQPASGYTNTVAVSRRPPDSTNSMAEPSDFAVTRPAVLTVNTLASLLDQWKAALTGVPLVSYATAVNV